MQPGVTLTDLNFRWESNPVARFGYDRPSLQETGVLPSFHQTTFSPVTTLVATFGNPSQMRSRRMIGGDEGS